MTLWANQSLWSVLFTVGARHCRQDRGFFSSFLRDGLHYPSGLADLGDPPQPGIIEKASVVRRTDAAEGVQGADKTLSRSCGALIEFSGRL
ncbi:hypothetical protein BGZ63DRAFT_13419 [Mariannaea sp. PMI_226]|nr:hypothetical protein BGZ63DRAFT_13419 [Mariannaea sp. PMI_226]